MDSSVDDILLQDAAEMVSLLKNQGRSTLAGEVCTLTSDLQKLDNEQLDEVLKRVDDIKDCGTY